MDMKLKCIKSIRYLTEGWYYRVKPSSRLDSEYWVFEDDLSQGGWYDKDLFQTQEDNRNEKINDITNDL
jgi:hypothetical protein